MGVISKNSADKEIFNPDPPPQESDTKAQSTATSSKRSTEPADNKSEKADAPPASEKTGEPGKAKETKKDEKSPGLLTLDDNIVEKIVNQENVNSSHKIADQLRKPEFTNTDLPVLVDVEKFEVTREFNLVNTAVGYIQYVPGYLRQSEDAEIPLDSALKNLAEDTVDVFRAGLVNVRYGLNKDKFRFPEPIVNDNLMLSGKGLQNIGGTTVANQHLEYINGITTILMDFVFNRDVYSIGEKTTISDAVVPSEFSKVIVGNYTKPVGAHLAIAAGLNIVEWVSATYKTIMASESAVYKIGRFYGGDNINMYRDYQGAYMNIDQYAAQMYNLNIKYFKSCEGATERLVAAVRAYADRRVNVSISGDARMSVVTDYETQDALAVLTLGVAMSATLGEALVAANEYYFAKANVFRPLQVPQIISASQRLGSENLFTTITKRMNGCSYGMVNKALAMETMPAFTVHRMSNVSRPADIESAFVLLVELFMVHLLTPDLFENLKGDIGNIILDCASTISATDVRTFKDRYGYRYSIVNGQKRFNTSKRPWRNEQEYFSDFYPSMFADDFDFTPEQNIVVAIMSEFKHANPVLYDCARAREAEFPRIDSSYTAFLPFSYSSSLGTDAFSSRVQVFIELLNRILAKAIKNGLYKGSVTSSALHGWFIHILERAKAIDSTLSSHLALVQETRSEAYCNFYKPFKGVYADFKRQNYGLISDNNIFGSIYHMDEKYQSRCATVNTGFVWHILFGSTSVPMDRMGLNDSHIPTSQSAEKLALPSPKDCLKVDMGTLSQMRDLSKAVGVISTLYSTELLADNRDMIWFRSQLESVRLPNAMFNLLVNLAISRVSSTVTDYGRVNFSDHVSTQKTKLQDPVFRRLTVTNTILDFDPNVDPAVFEDTQTFLTDLELTRLELGLKFAHRQPIQSVSLGVRVMKRESARPYPGDRPDVPDGYQTINTADHPKLFVAYDDSDDGDYYVNLDGRSYQGVTEWPKLHVRVKDRRVLSSSYRQNLLKGFEHAGWIIDILDVAYSPKIIGKRVSDQASLVRDILTVRDSSYIENIEFTDSSLTQGYRSLGTIPVQVKFKYIYPLTSIINDYVVSGFGNVSFSDEPPVNFKVPDEFDFDTGIVEDDQVTLKYTMPSMRLTPKVDSKRVSMSNAVYSMISNVEYAKELLITIGESPDFINISAGVSAMYAPDS